jgi:hypothetical protein
MLTEVCAEFAYLWVSTASEDHRRPGSFCPQNRCPQSTQRKGRIETLVRAFSHRFLRWDRLTSLLRQAGQRGSVVTPNARATLKIRLATAALNCFRIVVTRTIAGLMIQRSTVSNKSVAPFGCRSEEPMSHVLTACIIPTLIRAGAMSQDRSFDSCLWMRRLQFTIKVSKRSH